MVLPLTWLAMPPQQDGVMSKLITNPYFEQVLGQQSTCVLHE